MKCLHQSNNFFVDEFYRYSEKVNLPGSKVYIPFDLYPHQAEVAESLIENNNVVVSSARQMGMTSLMLVLAHWYMKTFKGSKVVYTTHSNEMLKMCMNMFKELSNEPIKDAFFMNPGCRFINGSTVEFKMLSLNKIGYDRVTYDLVLVDNAAFIPHFEVYQPRKKFSSWTLINSTPSGNKDWFYNYYTVANDYKKIHLPWTKHPNYNVSWLKGRDVTSVDRREKIEYWAEMV